MKLHTILLLTLGFTIPAFSFSGDAVIKHNWAKNGLNIRLQNDISSNIDGEKFELHQFGSTLIIRMSDSY